MSNKEFHRYDILHPMGRGDTTYWQKVGVLFGHENGVLSGELFATPLSGRIVVKLAVPKADDSVDTKEQ